MSGFDQNRFFLGVSRQLTPQLRAEVGYQNVFVLRAGETPDRLLHVALTSIVLSLRFGSLTPAKIREVRLPH